jgi:hypothetical protein
MFERMQTEFTHTVKWNPHRAYDEGVKHLHDLHAEALELEMKRVPSVSGHPHHAASAVRDLCAKFEERNAEVRAELNAREAERAKWMEAVEQEFVLRFLAS